MARMPTEIRITARVTVPGHECALSYARSGGPGGQHVNKTSSKVLLRWSLERTSALTEVQRERARAKLASRLTEDGELLITSERHREQSSNVEDALEKFAATLRAALHIERPRKATKPTRASKKRRVESKRRRSDVKRKRQRPGRED
ncbi:MAG: alternative ribosome rescue aminoacyl-tRNA hydrolase ArfB [Planctomycetota bacterium]|nr:alternative ribosome rescue aminoacyl-tRNA hydrolase ArfB [Planctomycetota bacterium]